MNKIAKFFHDFFHPHCSSCELDKEEKNFCKGCEAHKLHIDQLIKQNNELLKLIKSTEPIETIQVKEEEPIRTSRFVPWNVKRQELEQASKEAARLLKRKEAELAPAEEQEQIRELERKVGL